MPASTPFACGREPAWLMPCLLCVGIAAGAPRSAADETLVAAYETSGTASLEVRPSEPARLQALLDYYGEALDMQQYREAETAAKQRIEFLIDAEGSAESLMADALSDLALVQRLSEQYDAALQNYLAAIRVVEQSENMLSEKLIELLRGLGDTYMASGHADLALSAYDRALHVQHVNDGPHNLGQVEILDAMAVAEAEAGNPDAALGMIDRMFVLHARQYATDSEEMLPVLTRRAELLNSLGRHGDERLVYLDIVRIIEGHRGEADVSLIEPYTALGRTYLHEVDEVIFRSEPTSQTGETYLKKAVDVARKSPDADWLMQEQALIELGDYYTILDVQDKARQNYRAAWKLLSSDSGRLEQRGKDLEMPMPLLRPSLDRHANFGYRGGAEDPDPSALIEGYIVAQFTVNDRGRVTDISILESDPPDFTEMETRMHRTLRESVFRPRYENGNPTRTERLQFRHDFLYRE